MKQPPIIPHLQRNHDYARVIQVIETTIERRGTGKDFTSPIRIVTQYWSFDGELLAEVDPFIGAPPPDDAGESGDAAKERK